MAGTPRTQQYALASALVRGSHPYISGSANRLESWAVDKFLSLRTRKVVGFLTKKIRSGEGSCVHCYPSRSWGQSWSLYRPGIAPQHAQPRTGSSHDSRPRLYGAAVPRNNVHRELESPWMLLSVVA